jgi:hypothetical protein
VLCLIFWALWQRTKFAWRRAYFMGILGHEIIRFSFVSATLWGGIWVCFVWGENASRITVEHRALGQARILPEGLAV